MSRQTDHAKCLNSNITIVTRITTAKRRFDRCRRTDKKFLLYPIAFDFFFTAMNNIRTCWTPVLRATQRPLRCRRDIWFSLPEGQNGFGKRGAYALFTIIVAYDIRKRQKNGGKPLLMISGTYFGHPFRRANGSCADVFRLPASAIPNNNIGLSVRITSNSQSTTETNGHHSDD